MHFITPEYCKSIAAQLNEFESMTTPCKTMLFSLLRAFWLIRQKRYTSAEDCLVIAIESLVKHYGLK